MKYRVFLDDALVGMTDWLPIAQAAWDRAARDRDAAHHGGEAVLMIDGRVVASVRPRRVAAAMPQTMSIVAHAGQASSTASSAGNPMITTNHLCFISVSPVSVRQSAARAADTQ